MNSGNTAPCIVRPVAAADAAAICQIYNPFVADSIITFETSAVTQAEMSERIERISGEYPYVVAECDGQVAGYAYATRWRARAAYDRTAETTVYVGRGHEGRGIGRALYGHLLRQLRQRGFHAAIGGISLPNPASVQLHEACGFVKVAHFPQVGRKFDTWIDVGFWQLILEK